MIERDPQSQKQEIISYLRNRVMPILEPLQLQLLKRKPESISQFSVTWLKGFQENQNKIQVSSEDEEFDAAFEERLKNRRRRKKGREGVSGQIYSSLKSSTIELYKFDKPEETKIKLMIKLRNCLMFKNLSYDNLQHMIEFMKKKQYKAGQVVIQQGDIGNELFIVDKGSFKCQLEGKDEIERIYEKGQVFGELALLYNTRRASTITAIEEGVLYSLDRSNFNQILRDSVLNKNQICEGILNKSDTFSTMKQHEKNKLCENLKQISIQAGKYIIKEGQLGDRFFIVLKGNLVAEKLMQDGEIKSVLYYKKGDYFGQIALIRNVPRQASVKALTSSKLAYIERSSFKRLLGSLEQLLKRNEQRYRMIKKEVIKTKI